MRTTEDYGEVDFDVITSSAIVFLAQRDGVTHNAVIEALIVSAIAREAQHDKALLELLERGKALLDQAIKAYRPTT